MYTAVGTKYHVVVPISGSALYHLPARPPVRLTPSTAGVFPPGVQRTIDYDAEFSHLSILFPRGAVNFELQAILGRDIDQPVDFAWELDLDSEESEQFLEALRLIDAVSRGDGAALRQPLTALRLEQVLIHSLLFTQPNNYSELLRDPPIAGSKSVKVAVENMQEDPAHPWTLAELAALSSVSARSLQEGFRRTVRTSPMRYLRRIRLERVFEDLTLAESESGAIADAALRWGFNHLGHFGAFYNERFGEHPSDTLRRSRPRG
jgi:AraC-like DNA-binding protein